jgi:ankyrin repeat protein
MALTGTLDIRLLEKFLYYVPNERINLKNQHTGNTLLHHAAANCSAKMILMILQKGGDVTLRNDIDARSCEQDRISYLPLEMAIQQKRSK